MHCRLYQMHCRLFACSASTTVVKAVNLVFDFPRQSDILAVIIAVLSPPLGGSISRPALISPEGVRDGGNHFLGEGWVGGEGGGGGVGTTLSSAP